MNPRGELFGSFTATYLDFFALLVFHTSLAPGEPLLTDNRNQSLDCKTSLIEDPAALDGEIQLLPGVLGTGIFAGMAGAVIAQDGDRVEVRTRS